MYLEIEKYAKSQDPELFLFEVLEKAWETFKKMRAIDYHINRS